MKSNTWLLCIAIAFAGCGLLEDDGGGSDAGFFGGEGGGGGFAAEGGFGGEGGGGGFAGEGGFSGGGGFAGEGGFSGGGGEGGGEDTCLAGCQVLDECELCIDDGSGECATVDACAADCVAEGDLARAQCLVDAPSCDDADLDACFDGGDACTQACVFLDECEVCITDDSDECVSVADCAAQCRVDGEGDAECLNGLETCDEDAINACFDDDVCVQSCRELEECGVCSTDEAGECLSTGQCAESCRTTEGGEAEAQCVTELPDCDEAAINACFGVE